jgi:hypothetical protein
LEVPTVEHDVPRNERGERIWTMVDMRDAIERFAFMLEASDVSRATRFHYVENSTRFLNWLEGAYAPRTKKRPGPMGWTVSPESKSKYAPLRAHLEAREDDNAISLTFRHIEDLLGTRLPPSARRYQHWWSNDRSGNHTQANAWLDAGRRVAHLDLIDQHVMFIRTTRDARGGKTRYRPELTLE